MSSFPKMKSIVQSELLKTLCSVAMKRHKVLSENQS